MPEQHKLRVRGAVRSDLDKVAEVWHVSALSMDGLARDVPPLEALRSRIDAELAQGWELYVAASGDRILGFMAIRPNDSVLDQIFVMPEEKSSGIGRALMDVAKQVLPNGFSLRMDAANAKAARFYQHEGLNLLDQGFHPWTGIAVHFYGCNVVRKRAS